MGWFIPLLVALVINVVSYMMMPKPKAPKPAAARDMDDPTAEAGRPFPVVFGTVTVKGLNVIWHGEKRVRTYQVKA